MTTTFNKVALSLMLVAFAFGIFTYVSQYTNELNDVAAYSGGGGDGGCCGSDGGGSDGGGSDDDGGGNDATPPRCDAFSFNKTTVNPGDNVTATWSTSFAMRVAINRGVGTGLALDGSRTFKAPATVGTYEYILTASDVFGRKSDTCTATLKVVAKPTPTPVCDAFTVNGAKAVTVEPGKDIRFRWATTNATKVTINRGIGEVARLDNPDGRVEKAPMTEGSYVYTLTAKNGIKTDTCTVTVTVKKAPAPVLPKCDSFTVNGAKNVTVAPGADLRFRWATTNAAKVTINQGIGELGRLDNPDGRVEKAAMAEGTKTYTLTAINGTKNDTCTVTVTVKKAPAPVLPKCDSFTIGGKQELTLQKGQQTRLRWTTTNATEVHISSIGKVAMLDNPNDGRVITAPNTVGTYNYILTAKNGIKSDTCKVILHVTEKPVVEPKLPKCDSFTIGGKQELTLQKGQQTRLRWATTNATKVTINRGIGEVYADNTDGRLITAPNAVGTYEYILTAKNAAKTATCKVVLHVEKKPVTETKVPKCDFFTVNDDEVRKGTEVTLSWGTTNANRVEINNGIGRVDEDGDYDVVINNDADFTLTAYGDDGKKTTCSVDVNVESGGGGSPLPRCEFKASDRKIKAGERVELSWETRYGRELTIYEGDEDDGDEIYDTDDEDDVEEGEITVRPDRDTTYTLVVERGSRDRECDVKIEVEDEDDEITVIDDRDQTPRVAGITLTQVPYTGFEAGPMLTLLFYALLALWGLFVAYHFVIRKKEQKLY